MLKPENTNNSSILQGGGARLSASGGHFSLLGIFKTRHCNFLDCFNAARFAMTHHVILRALARRISCNRRSFTFVQLRIQGHTAHTSPVPFVSMTNRKKKAAFTLAEVLITLGIIGVVAAMTLPTLIAKYQEKVWLTQFKVTYSTLSQAYLRAYQEHGVIKNWGLPLDNKAESAKIVAENLLPYLNLAQDFKQNSNHSSHNLPMHYLGLNGKELATNFNGWESAHYIFALANGAVGGISDIGIDEVDGRFRVQIYVDTNGAAGPNQMGKDFFFLYLGTKNGYPIITGRDLWNSTQNGCSTTYPATAWYSGGSCAVWIIATGNMDYLHREITTEEWNEIVREGKIKE